MQVGAWFTHGDNLVKHCGFAYCLSDQNRLKQEAVKIKLAPGTSSQGASKPSTDSALGVLTKGFRLGRRICFKGVSAVEASLARDLVSDEEWAFFERFILAVRAPTGANPSTTAVFSTEYSGSPEPELHGATCPKNSANGRASTASSGAEHWQGYGKRSWVP